MKIRSVLRTAAFAAMFAMIAGTSLQAQEEGGGRGQRGGRGGGQRGGGQRGGGQRGGGQRGGGQRGGGQRGGGQRGGGQTSNGMSKAQLLEMEEVRTELKIEGDQLETVTATLEDHKARAGKVQQGGRGGFDREAFAKIREMEGEERDKAIADMRKKAEEDRKKTEKAMVSVNKETEEVLSVVLEEAQWKRLGELQTQTILRRGMMAALQNKELAGKLKMTKDQTKKLEELKKAGEKATEEASKAAREMFSGGGGFDREKFAEMRKAGEERQKKAEEKAAGILTAAQKKQLETMKGKAFKFPERRTRGGRGGQGRGGQGGGRGGRGGDNGGGGRPQRPGGGGGGGGA